MIYSNVLMPIDVKFGKSDKAFSLAQVVNRDLVHFSVCAGLTWPG